MKSKNIVEKIKVLRKIIDEIDDNILNLINQRLLHGKEIGEIKKKSGAEVLDRAREKEILDRLSQKNNGPLSNDVISHIFQIIMSASREIQSPVMIAYLGPETTNTHIAALRYFNYSGQFVPEKTIADIFEGVERSRFDFGIVPVENSIEGAVNHTLDLLFESGLKICAETSIRISHDLLSTCSDLSSIKRIFSHPQAFSQCRKWLRENVPNAQLFEMTSTAAAAGHAVTEKNTAAIANSEASRFYNIDILASGIEDYLKNTTRFLVIGKKEVPASGNDKTTLMFVTSHVPGALYQALKPVSDAGLNMVKLESRPVRHRNWHYFFVMDIDGHINDKPVQEVFTEMEKTCLFLKHSGSYPKKI